MVRRGGGDVDRIKRSSSAYVCCRFYVICDFSESTCPVNCFQPKEFYNA